MSKYFSINGYWKDDLTDIIGAVVREFDDIDYMDDDIIFYYGLSEQEIEEAIKNLSESALEFVITSYEIL
jgi:hypothetical protein